MHLCVHADCSHKSLATFAFECIDTSMHTHVRLTSSVSLLLYVHLALRVQRIHVCIRICYKCDYYYDNCTFWDYWFAAARQRNIVRFTIIWFGSSCRILYSSLFSLVWHFQIIVSFGLLTKPPCAVYNYSGYGFKKQIRLLCRGFFPNFRATQYWTIADFLSEDPKHLLRGFRRPIFCWDTGHCYAQPPFSPA